MAKGSAVDALCCFETPQSEILGTTLQSENLGDFFVVPDSGFSLSSLIFANSIFVAFR